MSYVVPEDRRTMDNQGEGHAPARTPFLVRVMTVLESHHFRLALT
jgi:hypothetical protein